MDHLENRNIVARGEDDNSFNLSWQLYVLQDGTLEVMLEDSRENNYCDGTVKLAQYRGVQGLRRQPHLGVESALKPST